MKTAKTLAAAALLTATALAVTACSPAAQTPHTSAAQDSVSLRMTTWTSDAGQLAVFNAIADAYKKSHPEIKSITFDSLPFADYSSTLTTQIAGGDTPDLAWVIEASAPDFVQSGALAPLTDKFKATKGYDYGDLSASATKLWTKNNQLYAYPFSTSPFVVFANDDMLTRAGLPTSGQMQAAGKWDWNDIIAASSQVNAKTGKAGMIVRDFNFAAWSDLATIWNAWGAAPWSADGKKCTFTSSKMNDAFTFIHDAIFKQKAMPGPGTSPDFFAGDSAFTITQISRASLLKTAGFKWDALPLPTGQNGKYAVQGQAGVGVLAKGKNAQEAESFLAFFTSPANAKKLAQYFPPPRTSLLTAGTLAATNPLLSKNQIQHSVIDPLKYAVTLPSHTNSAEIVQAGKTALDPMWQPNADVSSVLKGVCTALNPLLAG